MPTERGGYYWLTRPWVCDEGELWLTLIKLWNASTAKQLSPTGHISGTIRLLSERSTTEIKITKLGEVLFAVSCRLTAFLET
jgi:hypothetical protein